MRKTLVSLLALGTAVAVCATAVAQETAPAATVTTTTTTTAAAPAPAAPAATVITTTTAATPAPDAAPATTTVTTVVPVPPPAPAVVEAPPFQAPAPAVVEVPPPPPPAPTDPTTIQVLSMLEQVCKPMVQGGDLQSIVKPLGFKKNRDGTWSLRLEKPYQITVLPQGVNKNVCDVDITHPVGGDAPLTVGIHNYAIARGYTLYRNDEFTTDLKRHTRSWELTGNGKTEALVLVTEHNPDGSSVVKNADRSTLMYSIRDAS